MHTAVHFSSVHPSYSINAKEIQKKVEKRGKIHNQNHSRLPNSVSLNENRGIFKEMSGVVAMLLLAYRVRQHTKPFVMVSTVPIAAKTHSREVENRPTTACQTILKTCETCYTELWKEGSWLFESHEEEYFIREYIYAFLALECPKLLIRRKLLNRASHKL